MTRTTVPPTCALALALAASLLPGTIGCGPSRAVRLERQVERLEGELFDAKQRADDLKARMDYIRARNRVLIGLVEGLTSEPDRAPGKDAGGPMASATRALEALDHDIEVLGMNLRQSREDVTELRGERKELRTNLDDAIQRIEEAKKREVQAQARVETFRAMLLRLRSMIESNELQLEIVRNQMVLKLPETVLFDTGEAELKPRGRDVLTGLAAVLKGVEGREFQVAGHTDDVPIANWRYKSNWHLSAARAINVTRFLVKQGVPRERLSAVAYADTRPVALEHTEEARGKNRRIEIALMPRFEELPDLSALDETAREGAGAAGEAAAVAAPETATAPVPAPQAPAEPAPAPTPAAENPAATEPAAAPNASAPVPAPPSPPASAAPAEAPPQAPPAAPAPPPKPPSPEPVKPRELPPGYGEPPQ